MSAVAEREYGELLAQAKPQVVHDDVTYRALLERLSHYLVRDKLSDAEEKLVELITLVIKGYEKERFKSTAKAPAIATLKYLMEHQGLRQRDLVPDVFETESVASAILRSSRGLTVRHIKRLANRFQLSADVFIDDLG
jgi:antitoxin component HigA of HigAB toxin-antitoxin module